MWLDSHGCRRQIAILIPNKPIFTGEIAGSLFISGQHFGGTYRNLEKTPPMTPELVRNRCSTRTEPIVAHCFSP